MIRQLVVSRIRSRSRYNSQMTSPTSPGVASAAIAYDSKHDDPVGLSPRAGRMRLLEQVFESLLFNCRFFVLFAVVGSMLAAIVMFLKGCLELLQALTSFARSVRHLQATPADDKGVMVSIIPVIDNYMFA